MSGRLIAFPSPRASRQDDLRLRARRHALVVEAINMELQAREWGYVDEAQELALVVEKTASSLCDFERRVAGLGA